MSLFKYIPANNPTGKKSAANNQLAGVLLTAVFLLSSNLVYAQKWYQVEVVIFTQNDSFGEETASSNTSFNYPANWIQPSAADSNADFTIINKPAQLLNPDIYTMNRTGVYKVLYHQAWRQPGISPRKAPWLLVSGGKALGSHHELEGSIRLHLASYLHLETNLWLLKPAHNGSAYSSTPTAGFKSNGLSTHKLPIAPVAAKPDEGFKTFASPGYDMGFTREPAIALKEIYTLKQSERLKLGKTHYIDHPKLGILVKVVRAKAPNTRILVPASLESPAVGTENPDQLSPSEISAENKPSATP